MQATSDPATSPPYVTPAHQNAVGHWLLICLLLIGLLVAVGGYTRLSGSGLSITEWKPIYGTIPPLDITEWQEEFEKYKTIPQYEHINKGMTLDEFKGIYWPEFWHRNLGRLIGLVYALPMFFFMARGAFSKTFSMRMFGILALGGLQGLIGWIMVASGLQDRLYVHHLKLAIHFGAAMLLVSAIFWTWLDVKKGEKTHTQYQSPPQRKRGFFTAIITLLIFAQLIIGALVAGLHAGLIYNHFPSMDGQHWVASDVWHFSGSWFDHIPMVQFIHRWLAKLIVILSLIWWLTYRHQLTHQHGTKTATRLFFLLLTVQFTLGVLTLVYVVPIGYALTHQLGGVALLLASLHLHHCLSKGDNTPIQIK